MIIKKWTALLLAVMLFTGFTVLAQAEGANGFALTFEADEEQMSAYDKDLGGDGKTGAAIAQLLNKLKLSAFTTEDNAFVLRLAADETSLLDVAAKASESDIQIAASLLPGLIFKIDADLGDTLGQLSLFTESASAVLGQQASTLQAEVTSFLAGLSPETESGVFSGDAYTGGAGRLTYRFDDRDIALLGIRLLNKLEGMDEVLAAYDADWNELKSEMTNDCLSFADRNAHHYVVRVVTGEPYNPLRSNQPAPIGWSLTVFRGEAQIMTLSEGDHRMVLGFGYDNQVCFIDAVFDGTSVSDSMDFTGSVKLWQDPYHEGYRAASSDEGNLLGTLKLDRLTLIVNQTLSFVYDATLDIPGKNPLRETGRLQIMASEASFSSSLYYNGADTAMLKVLGSLKPDASFTYSWPEGKVVDLLSDDLSVDLFYPLFQGIMDLNAKLEQVLPEELYGQLLEWLSEMFGALNFD